MQVRVVPRWRWGVVQNLPAGNEGEVSIKQPTVQCLHGSQAPLPVHCLQDGCGLPTEVLCPILHLITSSVRSGRACWKEQQMTGGVCHVLLCTAATQSHLQEHQGFSGQAICHVYVCTKQY